MYGTDQTQACILSTKDEKDYTKKILCWLMDYCVFLPVVLTYCIMGLIIGAFNCVRFLVAISDMTEKH
jgi:hypothetical protein